MRSVNCQRKRKLRCCEFCRSGSSSVWVAISQSELTYGSSPPQIGTWRRPSPRVHFVAIYFTGSTSFRLRFLPRGKEEKTFRCWSNTSSIISRGKRGKASVESIKRLWRFFCRIPGQVIFANCKTLSNVPSSYAKQRISRWMRGGFRSVLLRASRPAT